jgi:hypothetical protein
MLAGTVPLSVRDVLVERYEADLPAQLRPALDALWNACGYSRSPGYAADGTFRHRIE